MPRGNRCQERIHTKSEYLPRENRVEKSRANFLRQAQNLVKLECDFSWQAQHFVQVWEIAGARNVVFFVQNASPRWDESGLRSGGCEMTISCSDHARIILESSLYWRKQFRDFSPKS